jgi:hypothetical protein
MKDILTSISPEFQIRLLLSFICLFALISVILSQIDFHSFAVEKICKSVWVAVPILPVYLFVGDSQVIIFMTAAIFIEALSYEGCRKSMHIIASITTIIILLILLTWFINESGYPHF